LDRGLEGPRTLAALAGLAGGIVLTLALIGLFGVTAFVVRHRTHEISVRRALGASQRDVVAMIVRESLRPVSIGLAIGVVLALLGGHTVQGVLYGVSARDPLAIDAAVVLSLAAAAAAAFVPARRAARVNPAELLKLQ
jgi:ABC-type antimicrobial peptide transport system permease subunit